MHPVRGRWRFSSRDIRPTPLAPQCLAQWVTLLTGRINCHALCGAFCQRTATVTSEKEAWAKFERRLQARIREHRRQGKGPNDPLFVTGYPQGSAAIAQRSILYEQVLERLFNAAKSADEFEYACALLNIEGLKDNGWSPEVESWALISEVSSFTNLPVSPHTKIRLGMLQYAHIAEMDITYNLIMNMLRAVQGLRYSMTPFLDKNGNRIDKTTTKINRIRSAATAVGINDVGELFDWYNARIRNSFAHSNYQLYSDRYNIGRGAGIVAEGVLTRGLSIEREILPRINGALRFFSAFYNMRYQARVRYSTNVVVRGRMGPNDTYVDVELFTRPEAAGLIGFRTPPSASPEDPAHDITESGTGPLPAGENEAGETGS
jgi:hypothetical protein